MLRYVTSFVVDHSDHPYFAGTYLIAALFALAGVAVSFTEHGLIAGFLVVYAVMAAFIGSVGYLATFGIRIARAYMKDTDSTV